MSYYKNDYNPNRFLKKPRNNGNKKTSVPPREYQFDDFLSDVGNQEIARLFGAAEARAKLKVGDPGDTAERDADKIADAVVKSEQTGDAATMQKKVDLSNSRAASTANAKLPNLTGGGKPMNENLKAYFEPRFGVDLGNVRLHTDENANRLSAYIHARAFAVGNDIAFATEEYKPETEDGKKLIAHEIAHTMQKSDGTVRRQVEEGWLLRENGTIKYNNKKGLTIECFDPEGKLKSKTIPATIPGSLSKTLMAYIGGRGEAEKLLMTHYGYTKEKLKVINDDDLAVLLMTTHGAEWNGKQYIKHEDTMKASVDKFMYTIGKLGNSLSDRLVFSASEDTMKYVVELKAKSREEFEAKKLAEKKERELFIPENFFKAYPEAKKIYDEHDLVDWWGISDEARLSFMKQYKMLYDPQKQKRYSPIPHPVIKTNDDGTQTTTTEYWTTCNFYYDDYLTSKGYSRVLGAIARQVFSPELGKKGTPAYNPDLFDRRNNAVHKAIEYEKKHGDEIETFTDPKRALDLTNHGHDIGVVGYYFGKDDKNKAKPLTHFSIVTPSNIILKTKEKNYDLFNLKVFPEIKVDAEPSYGETTDLLLAQSGARLGFLNYLWAFNTQATFVLYESDKKYYFGIIFIFFKKK
jgi:hypothetical protein